MLPPALKLRHIQIADFLSEETLAFTAELELYGKPVGTVTNDGHGGSHLFQFHSSRSRTAFDKLVQVWATRENVTFEPADQLVDELVERHQIAQAARPFARQYNVRLVLCVRKGPQYLGSTDTRPLGWASTELVPLADSDDAAAIAKSEGADSYHVIQFTSEDSAS